MRVIWPNAHADHIDLTRLDAVLLAAPVHGEHDGD